MRSFMRYCIIANMVASYYYFGFQIIFEYYFCLFEIYEIIATVITYLADWELRIGYVDI